MNKLIYILLASIIIGFPIANGFSSHIWYWGDNQPGTWVRATWDKDPITVGIAAEKGVDSLYIDLVQAAVNNWSWYLKQHSGNYNVWNFTTTIYTNIVDWEQNDRFYKEDITVYIHKEDCMGTLGNAGAVTSTSNNHTTIISGYVNLISRYCDNELTLTEFFDTARQEFGHVLGLGHVPPHTETYTLPLDVMVIDMTIHQQKNVLHHITSLSLNALLAIYYSDGFAGINASSIPVAYYCNCEKQIIIQDESFDVWGNVAGDYEPNVITVPKGTIVIWKNLDKTIESGDPSDWTYGKHTVTSGEAEDDEWGTLFDSGIIKLNKEFKYQFNQEGEYPYLCALHPWHVGKVIVK